MCSRPRAFPAQMPAEKKEKKKEFSREKAEREAGDRRNKQKIPSKRRSDGGQRNAGGRGRTEEEDLGINAGGGE